MAYTVQLNPNIPQDIYYLSPDGFSRYFIMAKILSSITFEEMPRILEVGGKGTLLPQFLASQQDYTLTVLDVLPKDKALKGAYEYIRGDATKQPFKTNQFDIVVSTDTLEHIPDKQKAAFVNECLRVAKDTIVIATPFQSETVDKAEKIANDVYVDQHGTNHPWLREHFQIGRPTHEMFEKILESQKLRFTRFDSNSLDNWLATTLPSFYIDKYPTLLPKLQEANMLFNKNLLQMDDFRSPGYRTFYVIQKSRNHGMSLTYLYSQPADYGKILEHKKLSNELTITAIDQTEKVKKQLDTARYELHEVYSSKKYKMMQIFAKLRNVSLRLFKNPKRAFTLLRIFAKKGPKGIIIKLKQLFFLKSINDQYAIWLKEHELRPKDLARQRSESRSFVYRPLISIITPTYNTPHEYLGACIDSVTNQTYDNWELCLADDASTDLAVAKILKRYMKKDNRIRVTFRKENGHISEASNTALATARGEYIALLDHDDVLWPNALYEAVKLLQEKRDADFIYTDEDKLELDGQTHVDPFFKPDWSPDYLRSINCITHFAMIRKSIAEKAGSFRKGYEGAQDWDLFLRVTNLTKNIYHIPTILYSWRKSPFSTASEKHSEKVKRYAYDAQRRAIQDDIERRGLKGRVVKTDFDGVWHASYDIIGRPRISIIIPTKNAQDYIKKCIDSIYKKSTYTNFEIIVVDTGSTDREILDYYKKIRSQHKNITILNWKKEFNFSAVCNFGARKCMGEYLLFLNNDTEVITHQWLEGMLEHAQRDWVGAVGAKLLYPDGIIQHLGGILGIPGDDNEIGVAGHAFRGHFGEFLHHDRLSIKNYSFVTAACLMVSRKKFERVGGFNEKFRIAWNDIDLCLRFMAEQNLFNLVTPHVSLIHHEAITIKRPGESGRDMVERKREIALFREKWEYLRTHDLYYNPNFSLKSERFDLLNL